MKRRDTKQPPNGYFVCPFCEHGYVDLPTINKRVQAGNKDAMKTYKVTVRHLKDYKLKKRRVHL